MNCDSTKNTIDIGMRRMTPFAISCDWGRAYWLEVCAVSRISCDWGRAYWLEVCVVSLISCDWGRAGLTYDSLANTIPCSSWSEAYGSLAYAIPVIIGTGCALYPLSPATEGERGLRTIHWPCSSWKCALYPVSPATGGKQGLRSLVSPLTLPFVTAGVWQTLSVSLPVHAVASSGGGSRRRLLLEGQRQGRYRASLFFPIQI
jgi:hypothetical protein